MLDLPPPPRYFPLAHGRYDVAVGLRPLGTDFGNGPADRKTFLFDRNFPRYRQEKLRARAEQLEKYYPPHAELSGALRNAVTRFLIERLVAEWPAFFRFDARRLTCALTGDELEFSPNWDLTAQRTAVLPTYRDALDALAGNLQEDLAVWAREPGGPYAEGGPREWLASVHLCFPNHWAAADKIGRPFNTVHAPVAGFERLYRAAPNIVDGMVTKAPTVRFAWGLATDDTLNHHPQSDFKGRQFDPQHPQLFLRIERQTFSPFARENGSLFTIRTIFLDANDLTPAERQALIAALDSMSPDSLRYKGLTTTKSAIMTWLSSTA